MDLSRFPRWLAAAAAFDWFFGRTFSRSAIFMPKSPPVLWSYKALTAVGQFAANLTSVLAIVVILWIGWRLARRGSRVLPTLMAGLVGLTLIGLLSAPTAPARLATHLIAIAIVVWLVSLVIRNKATWAQLAGVVLPASALLLGELYQAAGAISSYAAGEPYGPGLALFSAGEALALVSAFALIWVVWPTRAERWLVVISAIPALGFAGLYLTAPSISGVLAIWSLGLTLYLPWPLYALSLWACVMAFAVGLKRRHPAGLAIPMFVAGGYAPQLSTYLLLGMIALFLLAEQSDTGPVHQRSARVRPAVPDRSWMPGLEVEPQ